MAFSVLPDKSNYAEYCNKKGGRTLDEIEMQRQQSGTVSLAARTPMSLSVR